ncbi:MAG: type III-B CRISPR module RAMP protein Cmr6 [Planctomycetota bacterium]|nr:type III-B CRISPR module RAMP protein Cmr6 [Planctomycetota bacterium]
MHDVEGIKSARDHLKHRAERYEKDNLALYLDKYAVFENQEVQSSTLGDLLTYFERSAPSKLQKDAVTPFMKFVKNCEGQHFKATLETPMALHLSRSNGLENAGICMHPTYCVPFLPGSGLKGLARAYAETVVRYMSDEKKKKEARTEMERIFGYADEERRQALVGNKKVKPEYDSDGNIIKNRSGSVVFHDSLPETSVKLATEITNCHHMKYYGASHEGHDKVPLPGDWENPNLVYYPVISAGCAFRFAVTPTSRTKEGELKKARQWLQGALISPGVGGKTSQGFGRFTIVETQEAEPPSSVF